MAYKEKNDATEKVLPNQILMRKFILSVIFATKYALPNSCDCRMAAIISFLLFFLLLFYFIFFIIVPFSFFLHLFPINLAATVLIKLVEFVRNLFLIYFRTT